MTTVSLLNSHMLIKVSDEDWLEVALQTWTLSASGYASTGKHTYLHKLIAAKLGIKNPDHKDRDKLNNQRENLREATQSQQGANRDKSIGTSSKYKGVSWNANDKKWKAQIQVNGIVIYLGKFVDEKSAAKAYNNAATIHFGEFAVLNKIE